MTREEESDSVYVRPSTMEDAALMAPRLRWEDRREISVLGKNPRESLEGGIEAGRSFTVLSKDSRIPICIFGSLDGAQPYVGLVWLLGTPRMADISLTFLRRSQKHLKEIQRGYQVTHNIVMQKNTLHVRWLKWLGADFINKINIRNECFLHFIFNV